jgi:hypothetical protein
VSTLNVLSHRWHRHHHLLDKLLKHRHPFSKRSLSLPLHNQWSEKAVRTARTVEMGLHFQLLQVGQIVARSSVAEEAARRQAVLHQVLQFPKPYLQLRKLLKTN